MGEKSRKGFWNRLVPSDGRGGEPSPDVVAGWLTDDNGHAPPARSMDDAAVEEDDPPGVVIVELPPGSPLQEAGLRVGDLIAEVNGAPTPTEAALAAALGPVPPGSSATLTVIRGGWELEVSIAIPR